MALPDVSAASLFSIAGYKQRYLCHGAHADGIIVGPHPVWRCQRLTKRFHLDEFGDLEPGPNRKGSGNESQCALKHATVCVDPTVIASLSFPSVPSSPPGCTIHHPPICKSSTIKNGPQSSPYLRWSQCSDGPKQDQERL
eukprot:5121043-Amphidinium_carterae.1